MAKTSFSRMWLMQPDGPVCGARRGRSMDKDRIEGVAKQVKGSIKEAIGKVTGDTQTQVEGAAEKAAGKAQNTVGGVKDAARDALK
jgi:uncharacterized protein YjbJ (UPF0337 family)